MYLLNSFLSSLKIIGIKAGVRLTGTASGIAQMGQMLEREQYCCSATVPLAHLLHPQCPGAVGFVAPLTLTPILVLTFTINVNCFPFPISHYVFPR